MQIKPKILQRRKPEMTYITGVKNTVNPKLNRRFLFFVEKVRVWESRNIIEFETRTYDMREKFYWLFFVPQILKFRISVRNSFFYRACEIPFFVVSI